MKAGAPCGECGHPLVEHAKRECLVCGDRHSWRPLLCKRGHRLAGKNLRVYRGKRDCRQCHAIRQAAYRERKKVTTKAA